MMLLNLIPNVQQVKFPFAARHVEVLPVHAKHMVLSLTGTNGLVRIVVGREGQIVLKELIRADKIQKLNEVKMTIRQTASTVTVDTVEKFVTPGEPSKTYLGFNYTPPQIDTTIYVPLSTDLDIRTINGSIEAGPVNGLVRIKSTNGSIGFQAPVSLVRSVFAKTCNGRLSSELPLTTNESSVHLESYNGTLSITKTPNPLFLKGARTFDGKKFEQSDWYIVDGRFTSTRPSMAFTTLDFRDKYIVPPYADAHCHHIDGEPLAQTMNTKYLSEGTLYVQSMGNHSSSVFASNKVVNRSESIDVAFANAGLTSNFGHPAFLYESLAHPTARSLTPRERADFIEKQPRLSEGDAYFLVENASDLDRVWPKFLATDPDLVKIFLVNSENRDSNVHALAGSYGLNPEVVPMIVTRAHLAGLRVYAHVDSAVDMEVALKSGVDGLAHMPGYGMGNSVATPFVISKQRAFLAKGHYVQPTLYLAESYAGKESIGAVRRLQQTNINELKSVNARLVVGSDQFFTTQRNEAICWHAFGISNVDILHSLCTETPESIFPLRAIGRIEEDFEGSFVVLGKNPLTDISNAFQPVQVYKQGRCVWPASDH